ncbi:MAG: AzlC family ABC transporter permease [Natronomonas sp.]
MHRDLWAGIRDSVPINVGIVPFAMIVGISAVEAGLSVEQAVGMSFVVFAGASQLAAIELLGETAPLLVVVGTAVIINLRMVMYSASIAPYFERYRGRIRATLAYFLTDQAYAMSVAEFADNDDRDRMRYYLGLGGTIWAVWMVGTAAGAILGAAVPPELELSFAVPLVFLAILVPAMKDRPTTAAAVVGGGGALVAAGVPFNLGLLVGASLGILSGLTLEWRAA